jgi:glycosyltransferase involved in cell wall biosynthesis
MTTRAPATAGRAPAKVVRIIARLNTGGPAIHTVLLTRGLDPGRFPSVLVTGAVDAREGDMGYYAEALGVRPVMIAGLGRHVGVTDLVTAFVRLWMWLRTHRPAIIHTHTMTAGALGRMAGALYNIEARLRRRPRARLVHTFHGHVFHGYFSRRGSQLLVLVERTLARLSDRIVAVSDAIARDLSDRYAICPRAKVAVVPLGFDFGWVQRLDSCAGDVRKQYAIPPGATVVALVGRMTGIKNHTMLLAGMRRLRRPDLYAVLVGDGELRADIERAVGAAGLSEQVILTGWERDHARIYADVDIVCLTSRNEGTPVALIEAMAAGKPFVATRVGGVGDLAIGDGVAHPAGFEIFANCVLVGPDDEAGLAAALAYLADRPDTRTSMGAVGRASVSERFSHERLVRDVEALYAALL